MGKKKKQQLPEQSKDAKDDNASQSQSKPKEKSGTIPKIKQDIEKFKDLTEADPSSMDTSRKILKEQPQVVGKPDAGPGEPSKKDIKEQPAQVVEKFAGKRKDLKQKKDQKDQSRPAKQEGSSRSLLISSETSVQSLQTALSDISFTKHRESGTNMGEKKKQQLPEQSKDAKDDNASQSQSKPKEKSGTIPKKKQDIEKFKDLTEADPSSMDTSRKILKEQPQVVGKPDAGPGEPSKKDIKEQPAQVVEKFAGKRKDLKQKKDQKDQSRPAKQEGSSRSLSISSETSVQSLQTALSDISFTKHRESGTNMGEKKKQQLPEQSKDAKDDNASQSQSKPKEKSGTIPKKKQDIEKFKDLTEADPSSMDTSRKILKEQPQVVGKPDAGPGEPSKKDIKEQPAQVVEKFAGKRKDLKQKKDQKDQSRPAKQEGSSRSLSISSETSVQSLQTALSDISFTKHRESGTNMGEKKKQQLPEQSKDAKDDNASQSQSKPKEKSGTIPKKKQDIEKFKDLTEAGPSSMDISRKILKEQPQVVGKPDAGPGDPSKKDIKEQPAQVVEKFAWKRKDLKQKKDQKDQSRPAKQEGSSRSLSISSETSVQSLQTALSDISFTKRRESGTLGKKIRIECNYLSLNLEKMVSNAYNYDVTIDPDKPKRLMQKVFEKFRSNNFPQFFVAFDGKKIAYSARPLPMKNAIESEVKILDEENQKEKIYKVALKETKDNLISLASLKNYISSNELEKPMRAIQCIDIVLQMSMKNCVKVGRSFFTAPPRPVDLGDGYELWTGIFQSALLGWRPYLNVDVAHKGFPAGISIIDTMYNLRLRTDKMIDSSGQRVLINHLKGLRILYELPGNPASRRAYKFNGLKNSADIQTFEIGGKKMTVLQYFSQEKKLKLNYPYLPCLHVGNTIKNIYLPPEFCSIVPGQPLMRKLSPFQTQNMIKKSATSTDDRKKKIMDLLSKIKYNQSPVVKEFGLSIGENFTEIDARILNAPRLQYAENVVDPRNGVWSIDNATFLEAKKLSNWGILVLDDRISENYIYEFAKKIVFFGRKQTMAIEETKNIKFLKRFRPQELEEALRFFKRDNVQLLFVVIPNYGTTYQTVKRLAETQFGILTQCVKATTLERRMDISTIMNILLKDNSKLNGINHKMTRESRPILLNEPFIVVGADVTHPSPDQQSIPSVVGVAASYDDEAFKYNVGWRIQNPKDEMINDLADIIYEQVLYYKKIRNKLPEKILYYRDGVSDGQFKEVLSKELRAIYAGCVKISGPTYKPKVTFIVVQKRHHTRFFPGKSGVGVGKNNNVPPGTIVDTEITNPLEYQFFLVSHAAIQGVAKPTKYCILHDDNSIPANELQTLTYNLCHMFTRCNRSVSYVAPTYYAHLMAARGKAYIEGENINFENLKGEYERRKIKEEISKGHPMFFV